MIGIDRTEEIQKVGAEMLEERFVANVDFIQQDFDKNEKTIIEDCESVLNDIFNQASAFQAKSQKGITSGISPHKPERNCVFCLIRSVSES